jgi:hypothetical protein
VALAVVTHSRWNDLILNRKESDYPGFLVELEVTGNGVADLCLEINQRIGFSEDGKANRSGLITTSNQFFHAKDDLGMFNTQSPIDYTNTK